MDFSQLRINCSRLGVIMTEPQGRLTDKMFDELERLKMMPTLSEKQEAKRIELQFRMDNYDPLALSEGCKKYLIFLYQYLRYGRSYRVTTKAAPLQLLKGSRMESSGFDLIKLVTGKDFRRHKSELKNSHLKGRLDVIDGQTLEESTKIIEIKTPYTQFDFMKYVTETVKRQDNFQMQGYFSLTGKDHGEIYHCLSDFSEDFIMEQRQKMKELLCEDGYETDDFIEEWQAAERSLRFGHIRDEERVIMHRVERDDKIIAKINEKVEFCREWLAGFEEKHLRKISDQMDEWLNE